MAHFTTDRDRTETEAAQRRGPSGHHELDPQTARSTTAGVVAAIAGGLGVVAGIIPNLGVAALVLAALALVVGVPVLGGRTAARASRYARAGVVLAVAAVALGALNIAIQVEAFDFFTTSDA